MKRNTSRQHGFTHVLVPILIVCLLAAICFAFLRVYDNSLVIPGNSLLPSKQLKPFTFTAAGDFSSSESANQVLTKIGQTDNAFTLGLGDLGYGGNGTEQAWCDFVKQRIGNDHPFQLVAGNHDDGSKDGNILEYRKCLPDKLGTSKGDYGLEYYFDVNELARFIMISPDIDDLGYTYTKGSPHYNWLAQTIDEARAQKLEWVILGMHKNCITIGEKKCEIGEDLLNLAIEKKVDLILQGHEHAYMRSKQLALSADCPVIAINATNAACIAGSGNTIKKGAGSVIVISGAGGMELRNIRLDDPEKDYFETWNGKNVNNSYGFSLFRVSKQSIDGEFISALGPYTDAFSITR